MKRKAETETHGHNGKGILKKRVKTSMNPKPLSTVPVSPVI